MARDAATDDTNIDFRLENIKIGLVMKNKKRKPINAATKHAPNDQFGSACAVCKDGTSAKLGKLAALFGILGAIIRIIKDVFR